MTTHSAEVPPRFPNDDDFLRQARLMVRMAESIKVHSDQILRLTKMVVNLQHKSPAFGLPNFVRDGLLAFLTGWVASEIAGRVIS